MGCGQGVCTAVPSCCAEIIFWGINNDKIIICPHCWIPNNMKKLNAKICLNDTAHTNLSENTWTKNSHRSMRRLNNSKKATKNRLEQIFSPCLITSLTCSFTCFTWFHTSVIAAFHLKILWKKIFKQCRAERFWRKLAFLQLLGKEGIYSTACLPHAENL